MFDPDDSSDRLPPKEQEALMQPLSGQAEQPRQTLIKHRQTDAPLPLSFAQERLWFLAQLEPDSIAYHVPMVLELTGDVDVSALEWSLQQIVHRHEVLRTVFVESPEGPGQLVQPGVEFSLLVEDLRSALDQEHAVAEATAWELRRPFDLAKGPLLRGRLLRVDERRYLLLLCVHHIVFDAWSHGVLNRELTALYTARVNGGEPVLPELAVQYGDFALWQHDRRQTDAMETLMDYWRVQLAGVSPVLQLPTDRPRPATQSYRGDLLELDLPPSLVGELRSLSRTHNVTVFMTLLAAFEIVLSRYTGRHDFLLGAPSANRGQPELDELIGFFVNTLVLRADLRDDPSFSELLDRVRETCLGAFEHQGVPFEQLVDELAPDRDLSYNPLVQVLFAFIGDDGEELSLPGVDLRVVRRQDASAKFDLTLRVHIGAERGRAAVAFNADLFDRATIARMAHHLRTVLTHVVAAPDARLSEISIMDEVERHRTVVEWNGFGGELESAICLHHLVEQQVTLTPDAVAVQDEERSLTYRELNERANQIAWPLLESGVAVDSVVGVCALRSVEMIAGALGVLKAGAAYLPLDPGHPDERLRHLLRDARVSAVVAQEQYAERLTLLADDGVAIIAVIPDADSTAEKTARRDNPDVRMSPDNLAYVIYTSGSTGQPKGAAVSHEAISNNLLWMQRDWPLDETDRLLHKTQFTFDVSVKELFWPLLAGARLVMAHPEGHRDPSYLRDLIVREEITVTHFVPSMLQAFLAEPDVEACRSLRLVMCGAEALTVRQQDEFFRLLSAQLLHLYGPTEAAIAVTAWPCERDAHALRIPLGRPMPNCRIYVLDDQMEPVPVGVLGELYIAGTPLARGYLGMVGRTAERFVPDPFAAEPGGRLYRTGDIARWRPDGLLEFIGRADAQVKIRGLRIEPGEVESVLRDAPWVHEAVVLVRTDGPAAIGPQLVAYVRGEGKSVVSADSVREYLRDRVPDYLVPAAVVVLDDLPRLTNGKVDRGALPRPDWSGGKEHTPARTDTERTLLAIWCEVLGISEAGVHDNFFDLGGDSLLSIQVVSRARREGVFFTVRDMFRYQTVAELAATLQSKATSTGNQAEVTGGVPLTPVQHRLFRQNLPDLAHYTQARVLELAPHVQPAHVMTALQTLVAHHDALRMRFSETAGQWQQTNLKADRPVPLRRVDLSQVPTSELQSRLSGIVIEMRQEFDLGAGQLLHAALCDRGDSEKTLLVLAAHHLVVDGMSWRIVLEDLESALSLLVRAEPVALPPKTTSYREWALALTDFAQWPELRSEALYWSSAAKPVPPLPLEPREDASGAEIAMHTAELADTVTSALLHHAPRALRVTMVGILLAAYGEAVADWTGNTAIRVDLDGHGRADIADNLDLSRTVGWFTAVYPLRLDLGGSHGLADRLTAVHEQLEAVPNLGIGHGVLSYLRNDTTARTLRAARPCQLGFTYLGQFTSTITGDGPEDALVHTLPLDLDPKRLIDTHFEYPLSLSVKVVDGVLKATWIYRHDLIRPDVVRRLATVWEDSVRRAAALVSQAPHTPSPGTATRSRRPAAVKPGDSSEDPLVVLAEASPTAPRAIFVHPVSGHLRGYSSLIHRLSGSVSMYGMLAAGLAGDSPPADSVPQMAARYVQALHHHHRRIAEPYRLVGWSFGGLVAFEMACQLVSAGREVALVATIDSAAPATSTVTEEATIGKLFAKELDRASPGRGFSALGEDLADVDSEDIARLVARTLAERHGDREEDWLSEIRSLYQVYRANVQAAAAYRPSVYPGDLLSVDCRPNGDRIDRKADWPRFVAGEFSRIEIPGDHYSIVEEPDVAELARILLPRFFE